MEAQQFVKALFDGASEELKNQAIKANAAYKVFLEKDSLYDETDELLNLVSAQRSAARIQFDREQKIYNEMIQNEIKE